MGVGSQFRVLQWTQLGVFRFVSPFIIVFVFCFFLDKLSVLLKYHLYRKCLDQSRFDGTQTNYRIQESSLNYTVTLYYFTHM